MSDHDGGRSGGLLRYVWWRWIRMRCHLCHNLLYSTELHFPSSWCEICDEPPPGTARHRDTGAADRRAKVVAARAYMESVRQRLRGGDPTVTMQELDEAYERVLEAVRA